MPGEPLARELIMTTLTRLSADATVERHNVVGLLGNVDGRHPRKYLDDRRKVTDGRLLL